MNRWKPLLFVAAGAVGVAASQPTLARVSHEIKEREDVLALPPPGQLRAATLGWDAAAVDLLWTKLLVEYGLHWSDHREFENVADYVNAIIALEPNYRPLYRIVDTLLVYRPLRGTEADARMARAFLERGTRERPDDAKVWLQYGQFLAFIAPSFLRDRSESDNWRRTGAEAMAHAAELGAGADSALSAATLLTRAGANEQAIRYLARVYEMTPPDSEAHEAVGHRLATLAATAQRDAADVVVAAVDARWHRELPFLRRDEYLLLGPSDDALACAGPETRESQRCQRDWPSAIRAAGVHDSISELGLSADSP